MSNIFFEVENKYKLYSTKGASEQQINAAELKLKRKFSLEYKEYLAKYGAVSFGNVELTGLNVEKYANVVDVTNKEIQRNSAFPDGCIVLQNTGVEGVLVLMEENGTVYYWQNGKKGSEYRTLHDFILSLV